METIKTALFEDPFYIYLGLGFGWLVLLAIWYERRGRNWALSLLIPVALAGAVFAISTIVETDREQITRALNEIADDAVAGSTAAGELYLDDEYRGFGGSKEGIISRAGNAIDRYAVEQVGFVNLRVEVDGDRAETVFSTVVTFAGTAAGTGRVSLMWNIQWVRRPDGWRIIDMDTPRTGIEIL